MNSMNSIVQPWAQGERGKSARPLKRNKDGKRSRPHGKHPVGLGGAGGTSTHAMTNTTSNTGFGYQGAMMSSRGR